MAPSSSSWLAPPGTLGLARDEVHVWRAALDLEVSPLERLWKTLSADEQARARRFAFPRDRDHFIAGRGLLRAVLGRYLDRDPASLSFCYGPHGKPALERAFGGEEARFNLAHSHGLALLAVSRGREVGVDLEWIDFRPGLEDLAARFFTAREAATLQALPAPVREKAFFDCWTRKEAYLKARGGGLGLGLDTFEVSVDPRQPAALLNAAGGSQETSCWSLRELIPGPGYAGALAAEGQGWGLACWQCPEVDFV